MQSLLPAGHRQVWQLAAPLMISNISTPLVGAVDTAVVGHLHSADAIGAVALGALIFSFVYWGFGFLRMGTTGFVARAFGAGDKADMQNALLRALALALVLSALLVLFARPIISLSLFLLHADARVETLTSEYSLIRILSAPATLCAYVFTGVFIGMHNTRHALFLQLALNLCNIALDFIFVVGFKFGIQGVAWASVIAEYAAAALGFYLLRAQLKAAFARADWRRTFDRREFAQMLQSNAHLFFRTLFLLFAFAWFTAMGARQGAVILAANAILLHYISMAAYALDAFAHAAEAMVGEAFGRRNRARFQRNIKITSQWALASGGAVTVFYWLVGAELLHFFTDLPMVLATAREYLAWAAAAPLVAVASYQLDGIFIGAGQTRFMLHAMLASLIGYLLAVTLLLPAFGNHGLFFALLLFMVLRAMTLLFYLPRVRRQLGDKVSSDNAE